MSRKATVDSVVDADYSSGDAKTIKHKQIYQEENNNEVEELSKDLSEMGCIVDAVRKPSNICVEHCIYEGSESEEEHDSKSVDDKEEEDAYSEEFEEDNSDNEEVTREEHNVTPCNEMNRSESKATIDPATARIGSKSRMSTSSSKKPSIKANSDYGSISVPKTHRVNMSFSNERLRDIQRHNHILLSKIISARNVKKSSIPQQVQEIKKPVPSAALLRKRQQRQIEHDNLILLKKIQRAKSSSLSIRR